MVSYICKIVNNLLGKKFQPMVSYFYKNNLFDLFRPWLSSRSVADLIIRFISTDPKEGSPEEVTTARRIELINKLL